MFSAQPQSDQQTVQEEVGADLERARAKEVAMQVVGSLPSFSSLEASTD